MRSSGRCLVLLSLLLLALPLLAAPMRPAHAAHAMVSSVHPEGSRVGVEIMRAGGNAVDAAVAVGFALAVVHPQAGNLGGGGFMLVRDAKGAEYFLDFREKAPATATANMYLDAQGNVLADESLYGYKAVGVPGTVAGLAHAQKSWGKLPLARVMAPAIRLAREGFVLTYEDAQSFRDERLAKFPESRRIFQRNGGYYQQGEIFKQPELARTLERIAQNPADFYHGALAKELAAAIQKGGGLVTAKDLAAYEVKQRQPVHGRYRGYDIISAPPPSSGGAGLIEMLNILEGYDLARYGQESAESVHLMTEAFRRAFYDRAEFMGDPDFARIPVAQLIDKRYGVAWREGLDPEKASPSSELKRPPVFTQLETYARLHGCSAVASGCVRREPENTTHYSVVDADGAAVAVTYTLNDTLGSRVTAEGLGFLLNDEMDDFAAKPGVPNMFGLVQGPANAIGPNKRPLSTMTPTIVLRPPQPGDKVQAPQLFLVLGAAGGSRIVTTVAELIINVIDYGRNIQEALDAPRFHHQYAPDEIRLEHGFSPDTVKLLEQMGHRAQVRGFMSTAHAIMIDSKTGERLGGADGRDNGKALGY